MEEQPGNKNNLDKLMVKDQRKERDSKWKEFKEYHLSELRIQLKTILPVFFYLLLLLVYTCVIKLLK